MSRIKQIKSRSKPCWSKSRRWSVTGTLDAADIEYLLRIAEASENLLKHTISNRVSNTLDLSELRKALDGSENG